MNYLIVIVAWIVLMGAYQEANAGTAMICHTDGQCELVITTE